MQKKRIGILGGISHESTITYYELLHAKYFEKYHDYYYPEVVIYSLNFQKFTDLENKSNKQGYIAYISEGINNLENSGVDFILMAANSPHSVYNDIKKIARIPIISIVEVTAKYALKKKINKLLLLGIKVTMQSSFYQEVFEKLDMQVITPKDKEQDEVNRIIFDELVIGNIKEESKDYLLSVMNQYETDGVILGCTELPLILKQHMLNIPLLNTVEIHVNAALENAIK